MDCKEKIEKMYQAAISALAHIDDECESIMPKECTSCTRKKYSEAISMLTEIKKELI